MDASLLEALPFVTKVVEKSHFGTLWGGAVIAYLVIITTLRRQGEVIHDAICTSADRLSILAGMALAIVAGTALLNAWHRLAPISALWTTDYGITLIIKLVLVAVMTTIGASNRFFIIPAMKTQPATTGRFHRILQLDALLFISIIGIAAALGIQGPGEH